MLSDNEANKEKTKVEELGAYLNRTTLSDIAKENLLKKAEELYNIIEGVPFNLERAKVSLFLTCDKYLCAVPRYLPKPKLKYLSKARRDLKIARVDAIGRINSICKLLDLEEEVSNKAKELLLRCKNSYPVYYRSGSPAILAATAVYISLLLNGIYIRQETMADSIGASTQSLRIAFKTLSLQDEESRELMEEGKIMREKVDTFRYRRC